MSVQEPYIGIDEVGRGALAGPVVVAAVQVHSSLFEEIAAVLGRPCADSKKLRPVLRQRAAAFLREQVRWGIGEVPASEIDRLGLSAALRQAAGLALDQAGLQPGGVVAADAGLRHPYEQQSPTTWTVKGDETVEAIMYASILAKVYRDTLMEQLHPEYPHFDWQTNKGYGTLAHRQALAAHGPSSYHRRSFLVRPVVDK